MNYKEITELLKLISDSQLSEFKMKDGDFEISIKTDKYQKKSKEGSQIIQLPGGQVAGSVGEATGVQAPASTPGAGNGKDAAGSGGAGGDEEDESSRYLEIKSPMVGTFYRSPSPDKPPFIKVGDRIEKGDVVCIVEAMKLFNEIESEVSGKIVKVMTEDAAPVEYDQVLFLIDPQG